MTENVKAAMKNILCCCILNQRVDFPQTFSEFIETGKYHCFVNFDIIYKVTGRQTTVFLYSYPVSAFSPDLDKYIIETSQTAGQTLMTLSLF